MDHDDEFEFDREAIKGFHLAHHREQLAGAVAGGIYTTAEAAAIFERFKVSDALERAVDANIEMMAALVANRIH